MTSSWFFIPQLKNAFSGRKEFCEEIKSLGSGQCQLVPAYVTKVDSANKTDRPQQICKIDELNFTEEYIPDNDEILYLFLRKRRKAK